MNRFVVRFDQSIVLSEDALEEKAAEIARQMGGEVLWLYRNAFQGVAVAGVRNWESDFGLDGIASIDEVNTKGFMQRHPGCHRSLYLPRCFAHISRTYCVCF
jgi:hypothetical protein